MDNTPNIKQVADAALSRLPKHTYTIPEADKELPTDPKTVTVRQLTAGEEQQALEAASVHKTSYAYDPNGNRISSNRPVLVGGGAVKFRALSAGYRHTCGIGTASAGIRSSITSCTCRTTCYSTTTRRNTKSCRCSSRSAGTVRS